MAARRRVSANELLRDRLFLRRAGWMNTHRMQIAGARAAKGLKFNSPALHLRALILKSELGSLAERGEPTPARARLARPAN